VTKSALIVYAWRGWEEMESNTYCYDVSFGGDENILI
jgi:hypothetical protein